MSLYVPLNRTEVAVEIKELNRDQRFGRRNSSA
jgi:hypothetical protein